MKHTTYEGIASGSQRLLAFFVSFSELCERVVNKKENNVSIPGNAWD
ncbi:MAG: hypothetical protein KKD44_11715 [Proteobacteria bacterium]|nr:hypothetical protein [Pseudomonadota bacterium]